LAVYLYELQQESTIPQVKEVIVLIWIIAALVTDCSSQLAIKEKGKNNESSLLGRLQ
jgi:hypothetical protein